MPSAISSVSWVPLCSLQKDSEAGQSWVTCSKFRYKSEALAVTVPLLQEVAGTVGGTVELDADSGIQHCELCGTLLEEGDVAWES